MLQLIQCLDDIDLLFISHFPYHLVCLIMSYSVFSHLSSHINHISQFVHFLMPALGYSFADGDLQPCSSPVSFKKYFDIFLMQIVRHIAPWLHQKPLSQLSMCSPLCFPHLMQEDRTPVISMLG